MREASGDGLEGILVLRTLAAPERRLLRGRRGRVTEEASPEPVPTTRATLIRPEPFPSRDEAEGWLSGLRGSREAAEAELATAARRLARAVHAHRVATADPYAGEVAPERALVIRMGFGPGDAVADGRFESAWELPRGRSRSGKRSMEAPDERFAAILGGHQAALPCEELVLRARAGLEAGRTREAALEGRVALESLLSDLGDSLADGVRAALEDDRAAVAEAANAALRGELQESSLQALAASVGRMEAALKRRRLGA
jgi:hypothetical protein